MDSVALYYPNVEPPLGWLRSAALFFDRVASFVPRESEDEISDDVKEFAHETNAWQPFTPTQETAELMNVPVGILEATFGAIAKHDQVPRIPGRILVPLPNHEGRIPGHVFMHGTKLSPSVRKALDAHGLIVPSELTQVFMEGDWHVVNEHASDAILSHIGDRLASSQPGWTSLTDIRQCFMFAHQRNNEHETAAEDALAQVTVTDLVPPWIEEISLDDYVKLRERYADLRVQFNSLMHTLVIGQKLKKISDRKTLEEAAKALGKELGAEIIKLRQEPDMASIKKWGAFSLASIVGLTGAVFGGGLGIAMAAAGVVLAGLEKKGAFDEKVSARSDLVRMLAAAHDDIVEQAGL